VARTSDNTPPGELLAEAARTLRAVLDTCPPTTPRERATARRIEGAAVVLDALATGDYPLVT
jgi:hypothetical protein